MKIILINEGEIYLARTLLLKSVYFSNVNDKIVIKIDFAVVILQRHFGSLVSLKIVYEV
jgi:hypothetical protein